MTDWPAIVREFGPMAAETAWRILGNVSDAEDAVQEALLDALGIYRQQTVENWGALLRRLTTCRALDLLRKRRKSTPLVSEPPAPPSAHPHAIAVAAERVAMLRQGLALLPDREAEVFALRFFDDLSNPEIAQLLNITVGAVAVALHKGTTHLQKLLQPMEE